RRGADCLHRSSLRWRIYLSAWAVGNRIFPLVSLGMAGEIHESALKRKGDGSDPEILSVVMRYLVTGASGFIGSALVRALVRSGHELRALDNESRGPRYRLSDIESVIEWIDADVRDAVA